MANFTDPVTFQVGARCVSEDYFGTIRYVGDVPPAEGLWLGVEWDDPSRGKHSGEHDGVQYFTCSQPGSGVFIRPKKISLGYTFVEALQKRYGSDPQSLEEAEAEMYVVSKGRHVTPVEMVGAEKVARKQSQYDQLQEVGLRGMLVSSAGPQDQIKATTPNVQTLDLSQNPLLPSWEMVGEIILQLEQLHTLDLSENSILSRQLPREPSTLLPAFFSLRTLFMVKVGLSWDRVCTILRIMPHLEELHVCENKIANLQPPPDLEDSIPVSLQLLNLEENQLSDWAELLWVKHLPRLKTLILNDNQISEITTESKGAQPYTGCFPALESLSLSRNLITSWTSLNFLNSLPSLVELKLRDNPLLKDEPTFTARQLVIAKIGRLRSLNNSSVSDRERQLAERHYLKHFASEWVAAQHSEATKNAFNDLHPRYVHLANVHGLPEEALQAQKPKASALKDRLISVTISCPDHPDQKELVKKLPGTMTVQKLKGLLQRLYKVDSSDQKLSSLDTKGRREVELADDLRQLTYYSIETGDKILLRW